MTLVVELSGGMADQELGREALSLFGGKRVTAGIRKRLDEAVTLAVRTNQLVLDGAGNYILPRNGS